MHAGWYLPQQRDWDPEVYLVAVMKLPQLSPGSEFQNFHQGTHQPCTL